MWGGLLSVLLITTCKGWRKILGSLLVTTAPFCASSQTGTYYRQRHEPGFNTASQLKETQRSDQFSLVTAVLMFSIILFFFLHLYEFIFN